MKITDVINYKCKQLKYQVHNCSSFSSNYLPENILVNRPADAASRWSADAYNPPQFIIIKLEQPSIVQYIKFGKHEKSHMCNLKKFKVHGGLSPQNMNVLLESGLKNDNVAEVFNMQHMLNDEHMFPIQYIKIEPIQSWAQSFNFSIWYIEVHGVDDADVITPCLQWYNKFLEEETVKLCLKHFRQQNYTEAFHWLQKGTNVALEHPLLTELHKVLVVSGDYIECERVVETAASEGLFSSYLSQQPYEVRWRQLLQPAQAQPSGLTPGMRGGHQMLCHPQLQCIYLFGGWDGSKELSDFWCYHIPTNLWSMITDDTSKQGGPSARSCHKMCIDTKRHRIYTLGRYIDSAVRANMQENTIMIKSDMYCYDILSNAWLLMSADTLADGGPPLIFDHQHWQWQWHGPQDLRATVPAEPGS